MAVNQVEKEVADSEPARSQQELSYENNFPEDREIGSETAHMVKVERVYRSVVGDMFHNCFLLTIHQETRSENHPW